MDNEERQSPPPSDENTKTSCKCKRSMCLKLYCECFSRNLMCGEDCGCTGCHNTPNHERERQKTIDQCLSRDPNAFYRAKIQPMASIPLPATGLDEEDGQDNSSGAITMRGCNCRKTGCMKRYCECFNAGVKCTEACQCVGCKNGKCKPHGVIESKDRPRSRARIPQNFNVQLAAQTRSSTRRTSGSGVLDRSSDDTIYGNLLTAEEEDEHVEKKPRRQSQGLHGLHTDLGAPLASHAPLGSKPTPIVAAIAAATLSRQSPLSNFNNSLNNSQALNSLLKVYTDRGPQLGAPPASSGTPVHLSLASLTSPTMLSTARSAANKHVPDSSRSLFGSSNAFPVRVGAPPTPSSAQTPLATANSIVSNLLGNMPLGRLSTPLHQLKPLTPATGAPFSALGASFQRSIAQTAQLPSAPLASGPLHANGPLPSASASSGPTGSVSGQGNAYGANGSQAFAYASAGGLMSPNTSAQASQLPASALSAATSVPFPPSFVQTQAAALALLSQTHAQAASHTHAAATPSLSAASAAAGLAGLTALSAVPALASFMPALAASTPSPAPSNVSTGSTGSNNGAVTPANNSASSVSSLLPLNEAAEQTAPLYPVPSAPNSEPSPAGILAHALEALDTSHVAVCCDTGITALGQAHSQPSPLAHSRGAMLPPVPLPHAHSHPLEHSHTAAEPLAINSQDEVPLSQQSQPQSQPQSQSQSQQYHQRAHDDIRQTPLAYQALISSQTCHTTQRLTGVDGNITADATQLLARGDPTALQDLYAQRSDTTNAEKLDR